MRMCSPDARNGGNPAVPLQEMDGMEGQGRATRLMLVLAERAREDGARSMRAKGPTPSCQLW
jgi:hypothetical protein